MLGLNCTQTQQFPGYNNILSGWMVDSQSDESGPHLLIFHPLIQRDQYKHVSSNCVQEIIADEGM